MHEITLMQSVLEAVSRSASIHHLTRVTKVKLIVGKLTAVLPEALQFAFMALTPHTALAGATLIIEEQPVKLQCLTCNRTFEVAEPLFLCGGCGGTAVQLLAGKELYLAYYEGECNEEVKAVENHYGPGTAPG
jgi:hydrogenase nickel incorporation protein HypA/HybF